MSTENPVKIPKQFIFDPLRGADLWIRNQKFQTFGELESFCSYVGGSSLVSAMPILGVIKPDFEVLAIECGKAIMLTQLLANCVNDMKRNRTKWDDMGWNWMTWDCMGLETRVAE